MLKIYLARHGQNEDNVEGILNGHRDRPLTELGRKQAAELAEKIANERINFDAIYSSPLIRAYETAEIVAKRLGLDLFEEMDELIERDFGIMTGKTEALIDELCSPNIIKTTGVTYFLSPEDGESFEDTLLRSEIVLQKIQDKHSDGNIMLVAHGDIGKMIYAKYYELPWREVLTQFNFKNSDLILMSKDSPADKAHVFHVGL